MNHVQKCGTVEEALRDAANLREYKSRSTGRILLVEDFNSPKYIQKVIIEPETESGMYENRDMDEYEYVFVPRDYEWKTRRPKPENPIRVRFRFFLTKTYLITWNFTSDTPDEVSRLPAGLHRQ